MLSCRRVQQQQLTLHAAHDAAATRGQNRRRSFSNPFGLATASPLNKSAYRAVIGEDTTVAVFAYNFSDLPVAGKLTVVAPKGWKVSIPDRVELAAGERKQLAMRVHRPLHEGRHPGENSAYRRFGRRVMRSSAFGFNLK